MKSYKNWILAFLLTSSMGSLQAQTVDALTVDTTQVDTAKVELPWPQNLQARLDSLDDRHTDEPSSGRLTFYLVDS